jgi:hypothetical protein
MGYCYAPVMQLMKLHPKTYNKKSSDANKHYLNVSELFQVRRAFTIVFAGRVYKRGLNHVRRALPLA